MPADATKPEPRVIDQAERTPLDSGLARFKAWDPMRHPMRVRYLLAAPGDVEGVRAAFAKHAGTPVGFVDCIEVKELPD